MWNPKLKNESLPIVFILSTQSVYPMRVHNPEYQPPVTFGSRLTGCVWFIFWVCDFTWNDPIRDSTRILHLLYSTRWSYYLLNKDCNIYSDGDPLISRKRILIHISGGLDSILIFIKHLLSILKMSNVFLLRTSGEF